MSEGRIRKALSGFYYVDTGSEVLTCRARGKFRKEGISPLVGDRVEVRELGNGEGFVEAILPPEERIFPAGGGQHRPAGGHRLRCHPQNRPVPH